MFVVRALKWGLGIGDWGLGIGDWAQSPIPIIIKIRLFKKILFFLKNFVFI